MPACPDCGKTSKTTTLLQKHRREKCTGPVKIVYPLSTFEEPQDHTFHLYRQDTQFYLPCNCSRTYQNISTIRDHARTCDSIYIQSPLLDSTTEYHHVEHPPSDSPPPSSQPVPTIEVRAIPTLSAAAPQPTASTSRQQASDNGVQPMDVDQEWDSDEELYHEEQVGGQRVDERGNRDRDRGGEQDGEKGDEGPDGEDDEDGQGGEDDDDEEVPEEPLSAAEGREILQEVRRGLGDDLTAAAEFNLGIDYAEEVQVEEDGTIKNRPTSITSLPPFDFADAASLLRPQLFDRHDFAIDRDTFLVICTTCRQGVQPQYLQSHCNSSKHPNRTTRCSKESHQLMNDYLRDLGEPSRSLEPYLERRQGSPPPLPLPYIPGLHLETKGISCLTCGFSSHSRNTVVDYHQRSEMKHANPPHSGLATNVPIQTIYYNKSKLVWCKVDTSEAIDERRRALPRADRQHLNEHAAQYLSMNRQALQSTGIRGAIEWHIRMLNFDQVVITTTNGTSPPPPSAISPAQAVDYIRLSSPSDPTNPYAPLVTLIKEFFVKYNSRILQLPFKYRSLVRQQQKVLNFLKDPSVKAYALQIASLVLYLLRVLDDPNPVVQEREGLAGPTWDEVRATLTQLRQLVVDAEIAPTLVDVESTLLRLFCQLPHVPLPYDNLHNPLFRFHAYS
ncbi:hypothetical protein JCM5353_002689, partial [Sporobolomyces roseus]